MFSACKRVLFAGLIAALSLPVMLHGQLPPEGKELVRCNNEFAFQLYRQLRKTEGNLFFSPYSISCALSMAAAGARGETEIQMRKTLCFPDSLDSDTAFGQLTGYFNKIKSQGTVQLNIANALWVYQQDSVKKEYLELIKNNYESKAFIADFGSNSEALRVAINVWIEQQTNQKIKEMLSRGVLKEETVLTLVNAVYFLGKWESPFKKGYTNSCNFWVTPEKKVQALMMYQNNTFNYTADSEVELLELPYSGNEMSMVVILPVKPEQLSGIESKLDPAMLEKLLDKSEKKKLNVFFPMVKMEADFNLKDTLFHMGITHAFFSGSSNFSGINGNNNLYLGNILHKSFVYINEQGTEAAAATFASCDGGTARTKEFRADHPFIFLIRDRTNGSILFMGRVVNPPANIR